MVSLAGRLRTALFIGVALFASSQSSAQESEHKWGAFFDIEGKVGTKRNLGEVNLVVPIWQDERSLLFGDVRFKADDQNSQEGNFGLAARRMLQDGWNAGLYGFYDHRRSPNANLFDQFTFGVEALGTNFDMRANSYWPIGNTAQTVGAPVTGPSTAVVSGTSLQVITPATLQRMEYALRGFDAEVGVRIPITPTESPYNLRFYAGGFRFDDPTGAAQAVAGPRLRLEFTDYQVPGLWNGTRFTVSGEWQTDDVRGSQFFAGLRLRVPLQAESRRSNFTLQERRMTDTIVRDVDIVANTQTLQLAPAITEAATATSNGQSITVVNSSSTTGAQLQTALNNAGSNSTVVMSGTFNTTSTTTLQSGQTVIGSGSLFLRTASGRTVMASLQGGATVAGSNDGATIAMANNSTLSGMTIRNATSGTNNPLGISLTSVSGATITNSTISSTTSGSGFAAALQSSSNSTNVLVSGNAITGTNTGSGNAFGASVFNSTITFAGNIFTATSAASQGTGIDISSTTTATIINNSISASGGGGGLFNRAISAISSTMTVAGNSLSATGGLNYAVDIFNMTIKSGSTGNVRSVGTCNNGGTITGSMLFTNGTTCP